MSDVQPAVVTPPAATVATPAPAVAPAPANPTVPVQPAPASPAPITPASPASAPTEQLLTPATPATPAPVEAKPTVEALKLPEGMLVPKELLPEIISSSKTLVEAQARLEQANAVYKSGLQRLEAQNQSWISELKADQELGGQNWDESVSLYNKGVKRLFGEKFVEQLRNAKLDAMPEFVRGVVRAERLANPKPMVPGTPEAPKATTDNMAPWEKTYGPDKTYDPQNPSKNINAPRW